MTAQPQPCYEGHPAEAGVLVPSGPNSVPSHQSTSRTGKRHVSVPPVSNHPETLARDMALDNY